MKKLLLVLFSISCLISFAAIPTVKDMTESQILSELNSGSKQTKWREISLRLRLKEIQSKKELSFDELVEECKKLSVVSKFSDLYIVNSTIFYWYVMGRDFEGIRHRTELNDCNEYFIRYFFKGSVSTPIKSQFNDIRKYLTREDNIQFKHINSIIKFFEDNIYKLSDKDAIDELTFLYRRVLPKLSTNESLKLSVVKVSLLLKSYGVEVK